MNLRRERSIANDHLVTGEMEGVADGTGSRVEPIAGSELTGASRAPSDPCWWDRGERRRRADPA
jgi:hypothetical protein